MDKRAIIKKPGMFSSQVAADSRRLEFDYKNEIIVTHQTPVDFVFIGDSITHFWELDAYFGAKGRLILNRGIGGDTTEYVLKRFEADVLQLKPRYAIMNIGVNDTWKLEGDPWQRTSGKPKEPVIRETVDHVSQIIELAKKAGQHLILCSILPTDMPFTQKNKERNEVIAEINGELKKMAQQAGLIYVDYHTHFAGEDGITLKEGWADDGVHPHVLGYDRMAEILSQTLKAAGIKI